ncbi:MAG: hypothetical protein HXY20_08120 [Acidobacteria bacterium]|nr:hypothetical protein [Acidobacteriota bacterium]
MKVLVNVLVWLAVLAFVVGAATRFLFGGAWLGQEAVVYWRGAIGFLAFASTLTLIQIRDK